MEKRNAEDINLNHGEDGKNSEDTLGLVITKDKEDIGNVADGDTAENTAYIHVEENGEKVMLDVENQEDGQENI